MVKEGKRTLKSVPAGVPGKASGDGLPGLPTPAPEKPKKVKKEWSGTWIDSESTKKDDLGGTITIAKVKTNITTEVDNLFNLARRFASIEIVTMDGGQKVNAEIESYALKAGRKPGSFVATITISGSRVLNQMISRNVVVTGRQKAMPTGEEQGEPR